VISANIVEKDVYFVGTMFSQLVNLLVIDSGIHSKFINEPRHFFVRPRATDDAAFFRFWLFGKRESQPRRPAPGSGTDTSTISKSSSVDMPEGARLM
jgi:hypothetical protein